MTIILPADYHAQAILETNRITCIRPEDALHQDIRPMRIGILNIMPFGHKYEFNLLHPLGLSIIQVDPVWIKLHSHTYHSTDKEHIEALYVSYEDAIKNAPLDGLIITGAPIEHIPFEEVQYWQEVKEILLDAKHKCPSTLGICWGAFALAYLEGVDKYNYPQKLFGVFEIENLYRYHPITGVMDDISWCPQSRLAGLDDRLMEEAQKEGKFNLLGYGKETGYVIFETPDHRFVMHSGHPEYNSQRLVYEAERDRGNPTVPPAANFDSDNPANRWRGHRNQFFGQWLKYCYTSVSLQQR
ncbi:MAG: homoserine O-succinyltransferase [SAR324 cluster bacterium]|nr:homoserine O-succinyltransferase [SAR324 cluster bacterium]